MFSQFLLQHQEELTQAKPFAVALGTKYEGHVAPRSFFAAFAWDEETAETTMPSREPTQAEPFAVAHKQNLSLSLSGKSTKASLHLVASLRRLRPQ